MKHMSHKFVRGGYMLKCTYSHIVGHDYQISCQLKGFDFLFTG